MSRSVTFNLLKPLQPPKTAWDKIYDWILSRARIVILLTIVLITISFIAKVIVDTDAKNKTKEIDRLEINLEFYSRISEPKFRRLITKADLYTKIWNSSASYSDVFKEIYSYVTNSGADITIRFNEDRVSIYGTEDLELLRTLENSLRNSKTFSSVVFSSLSQEREDIQDQKGQYIVTATLSSNLRSKIQ
jgi:hypothetical protein